MISLITRRRHRRRQTAHRQRGAALVELALVAAPLMTLVLGMAEIGLLWKTDSQVATASRQGARVASHLGTDPLTDQATLRAVVAAMGGPVEVEYVIVFDATRPELAQSCTGSPGQRCNRYEAGAIADIDRTSRWGCAAGSHDANWCPINSRSPHLGSRDTIGVAVGHRHELLTNFFGSSRLVTASTSMAMEPVD